MDRLQISILDMLARGAPARLIGDRLCREVETSSPGTVCTVIGVDRSGLLHPLSAPSLPASFAESVDNWMIGPNAGACGTAAYLREPVVVSDIEHDPRWGEFGPAALALGLRACWSTPVFDSTGEVIGTFAIYYRERRGPTGEERSLVDLCARLCAIAMERHERALARERRARFDALTGLPDHDSFRVAIAGMPVARPDAWGLLLIDIDNLHLINDTFGRHLGDRVLQGVAARIAASAAPDKVFRVGGNAFAVLVQDPAMLGDFQAGAEAILAAITAPLDCDVFVVTPRATIGGAVVLPGDENAEMVRRNADFALYHAKELGRGGFVRYWPGIGTRMTDRLSSIRNVEQALRDDRIVAYYQPIVRLDTGEIIGVEALCRLILPGGEILAAGAFSDAITDARIAASLTDRMLALVADDLRRWFDMGLPLQHVSINATSADFRGGNLREKLVSAFDARGIPLHHVTLEVTEQVYIGEHDHVVAEVSQALRSCGLRVALDDFGTGYASLTHLLSVPVDAIKIDRSFIARMAPGDPSLAIIEGLLEIARKLGIRVVAEGVETVEQAAELVRLGGLYAQGFLFSRAVDARQLATLLRRHGEGMPNAVAMPVLRTPIGHGGAQHALTA
ncbi:putative bifunctional diguanylate cyclase/phosphodiesterase [Sphingomonas quercus]|uniref:EAL domain-containing protein n=1 Tax=Sphingomonas quercus TaxID=2842451 RepID=A0ABS6BGX9_9SPHN|nr:GGDEF domain-containing protein [Sphingomonas quercus]MBU3076495.1 EAL domain-containing protein [Sphingomonas quercus]